MDILQRNETRYPGHQCARASRLMAPSDALFLAGVAFHGATMNPASLCCSQ